MNDSTFSFRHSGDMGDIVAGMAAVKEFCERRGVKARILLDVSGAPDNDICTRQSKGLGMKFRRPQAEFLAPLLRVQPYVDSVETWDCKEQPDCDLNDFRRGFGKPWKYETRKNLLYNHQKVLGLNLHYNGPWLYHDVTQTPSIQFAVARSNRYHSSDQVYRKHVVPRLIDPNIAWDASFLGTRLEYDSFVDCFRVAPTYKECFTALDLQKRIMESQTFYCNGTLAYWIALGAGHPHIVHEVGFNVPSTVFLEDIPGLEYWQGGKVRRREELV